MPLYITHMYFYNYVLFPCTKVTDTIILILKSCLSFLNNLRLRLLIIFVAFEQAKTQDLVLPAQKIEVGDEFEGATVIEPNRGYVAYS